MCVRTLLFLLCESCREISLCVRDFDENGRVYKGEEEDCNGETPGLELLLDEPHLRDAVPHADDLVQRSLRVLWVRSTAIHG